ncbi:MAG: glycosyltransferase, partial [Verrucomicrobia bacterium]|nr:glycosyltransferase [Verrucomicrobiota bacterium]
MNTDAQERMQLVVVEDASLHGMPVRALKLCVGMRDLGYPVMLAVPQGKFEYTRIARENGVNVCEFRVRRFRDTGNLWKHTESLAHLAPSVAVLGRMIVRQKVAVVHCFGPHHILGPLAGRAVATKVAWHMGTVYQWTGLKRYAMTWMVKHLSTKVVSNCWAVAEAWLGPRARENAKCVVIPTPVDLGRFRPSLDTRALREELAIGGDEVVLVQIAAIYPFKGIDCFIKAIGIVTRRIARPVRGLIVGPMMDLHRAYYEKLLELREALGLSKAVSILKPRHDIPEVLNLADIVVIASLTEGLP